MRFFSLPKIKEDKNGESHIPPFESQHLVNKIIFSTLFDHHPDAVFILKTNGKINLYNPSLVHTFSFSESNIEREFAFYFFNKTIEKYVKLALNGQSQSFIESIESPTGKVFHVDITLVPLMNSDMKVLSVYGVAKDISDYIETENKIKNVLSKFELAQKCGNIGSWEYDVKENAVYWSKQVYTITGREEYESFAIKIEEGLEYVHPEDLNRYEKVLKDAIHYGKDYCIEFKVLRKDRTVVYVYEQVKVILDETGKPERLIGSTQDISKRKLAEKKLHDTKLHAEHIYNNLSLGIGSYDLTKGEFTLVTPGMEEITGYTFEKLYEDGFWESIIHPDDLNVYKEHFENLLNGKSFTMQYRIYNKDGNVLWVHDKKLPVFDEKENVIRIDGIVTNITEQKEAEEKIHQLAYYDSLTKLPNGIIFNRQIEKLIVQNESFSVMALDLAQFRTINNTIGHSLGDQLLLLFCERMKQLLEGSYLMARTNGDKFGIIVWNYEQSNYPETIAKAMIDSLKEPFSLEGYELYLTVSIGISTHPSNGNTLEEILNNTHTALYRAKVVGKNNYQIYSSTLNISSFKKYELERDLRKSIERNELIVYFQPRVDTRTGKIVSAEALTRWQHPIWGLVSPGEFIPIAEESGFINELGDWVIQEVCKNIAIWKQENLRVVPISININAQRFLKSDWVPMLLHTLKKNDVDPALIELEITETTLIHYEKEVQFAVDYLKELGIKVALDDFGTGYSSLTYLKDFAINTIKIDRSFISQIAKTPNVEVIIKSLIFMARGMEMNVVAEGVETLEQLEFLKQQECTEIQGYIFSEAVPIEKFQSLLKKVVLKPSIYQSKIELEERRQFYRIDLLLPLCSEMTLTSFKGQAVNLGKTEVLIGNIGAGGLKFLSMMQLPVRPDMIYQFETIIMNHPIKVNGHIVWKVEDKENFFRYGIEFIISEKERDNLLKILNVFSLKLKDSLFVPDCLCIQDDKYSYLKKVNSID